MPPGPSSSTLPGTIIPPEQSAEKGAAVIGAIAVMLASACGVYFFVRWRMRRPDLIESGYALLSPIRIPSPIRLPLEDPELRYPWEEEDEILPEEVEVRG